MAKVTFLHVSVILLTGGVSGEHPPTKENPPRTKETPPDQGEPPPDQGEPPWDQGEPPLDQGEPPPWDQGKPPPDQADPPTPGRTLQHTVNERPVRILLECILVFQVKSQTTYIGGSERNVRPANLGSTTAFFGDSLSRLVTWFPDFVFIFAGFWDTAATYYEVQEGAKW